MRCKASAWHLPSEKLGECLYAPDDDRARCQLEEGHYKRGEDDLHHALGFGCEPGTVWSGDLRDLMLAWSASGKPLRVRRVDPPKEEEEEPDPADWWKVRG